MINLGVIGYGYWGPNLVRNFIATDNVNVVALCDKDVAALNKAKKLYPHLEVFKEYKDITTSSKIDAVAISTPVFTHFELSKSALNNGKHIFVEKPFTASVSEAQQLIELAEQKHRQIMVDHTFLFTGSVMKIKELVNNDTLGKLYYYDSTRVNLGLFQHDVNVIWDLAPHDFSIMDYVIGGEISAIVATGADHFGRKLEDIAYITIYFDNSIIAHLNVNWLSPVKVRTTLIGGEKKMLVWNDLENDEKIKLYDKGVDIENNDDKEGIYKLLIDYRSGDMWAPKISPKEALKTEAEYFIECVLEAKVPVNDGHAGLRVVKMLEASDKSLKRQGELVKL